METNENQTVKQIRAIVKNYKGKVYMNALVRDDTWMVQVLKADEVP